MATVNVTTSQNLTSVTYAADDDLVIAAGVTLTITATPTTRIKSIQGTQNGAKLQVTNTSTSNMLKLSFTPNNGSTATNTLRFENGGLCEMDGDWITVYTGNGLSGQTVFSNMTVGGEVIDYPTFVEVETGVGTGVFEKWVVVPERVTNFHQSAFGFNSPDYTTGTVAVATTGVVTGTSTNWGTSVGNKRFRAAGHTQDYLIGTRTSTTSITILNPDGSAYSGGSIAAGATYTIKQASVFDKDEFGNNDAGTVLFFNPLTQAVTCGDGVNGKIIPNGHTVRVPNIYVTCDVPTTTLAAAITGTGATNISLTSGADFPSSITAWSATTNTAGTLLIIDSTSGETERIGFATRTTNTINSTSMVRGALYTTARTHANGSTVKYITAPGITTTNLLDLNSGGSIDCYCVMFGQNFSIANQTSGGLNSAKDVKFENVGFCGTLPAQSTSASGTVTFKNVCLTPSCITDNDNLNHSGFILSNVTGPLSLEKVFAVGNRTRSTASTSRCFAVLQATNLTKCEDIKSWGLRTNLSGGRGLEIEGANEMTIKNLYSAGGVWFGESANSVIEKVRFSGNSLNSSWASAGSDANFEVGDGCFYSVFRELLNYETLKPFRTSNLLFVNNDNHDIVVHNKGFATYDVYDQPQNLLANTGKNNTFAYLSFTNNNRYASTTPIVANRTSRGTKYKKITSDQWDATLIQTGGPFLPYAGEVDNIFGPQPNLTTSAATFDISPMTVMTDALTASGGYLVCGPFLPEETFSYFSGLSTTAYLTGANELYITTSGDQVTISTVYPLKGISTFDTTGTITYVGTNATTGLTYEFRMVNWGDNITVPAYQPLTLSDLETTRAALTGYSTSVGINLQIRITATTTSSTRRISGFRMPITLDTSYAPAVGSFDVNINGILSGSVAAISTDNGTTWPDRYIKTASGTTLSIPIDCDFLGTTTNLKVRIRKAGYQVLEYDLTTVDVDVDLPIEQVQVVDIEGVAVYGRGAGTTDSFITFDPANLRVDIGNIKVIGEDLYDVIADYQANTTGIKYPEILQFDGTDTIILNTWKLRRDVAGSTNAMVDVAVIYGPNTAINPVDEVNGSVQMFPRTVRTGSGGGGGGLTAAQVWDYSAASVTTAGSIGLQLKNTPQNTWDSLSSASTVVGSQGKRLAELEQIVWNYPKSSVTVAGSIGEYITKKLLDLVKFLALK